jgi:hypothetical protein
MVEVHHLIGLGIRMPPAAKMAAQAQQPRHQVQHAAHSPLSVAGIAKRKSYQGLTRPRRLGKTEPTGRQTRFYQFLAVRYAEDVMSRCSHNGETR